MTKLELMICEAENNGEIDLDTRNSMLGILNESTRYAREALATREKIKKLEERYTKMKKLKDMYRKEGKDAMANKVSQTLDDINAELKDNHAKLKNLEAGGYEYSDDGVIPETSLTLGKKRDAGAGSNVASMNRFRKPEKTEREPGAYKTCKGLKESVLEEIYEAELCGDITPEERAALIDYMED